MLPLRTALAALAVSAFALSAEAQILRRAPAVDPPVSPPPAGASEAEQAIWPYPLPDPKGWWDDKWPKRPEAADPLGGRRVGRGERLTTIDNGIDASTYRMWALMPLQWQVLRGDEMILEVWVRPARSVRQSVARVIVRRDGETFVQALAGLACCDAGIARRMGFDVQLPAGSAQRFLALRSHPALNSPLVVRAY